MTALNKILIITSVVLVCGVAYQIHLVSRQCERSYVLAQKKVALDIQAQQLREQRNQILTALSAIQKAKPAGLPSNRSSQSSELEVWLGRVNQLEQTLRQSPEKEIPEMKYLNSNDWLSVTLDNPLDSDARIRDALSKLRLIAKTKPEIATNFSDALQAYRKANNGQLPTDSIQLNPYLNPPLPTDILRRYGPTPEIAGENDANGLIRDGMRFLGSGRVVIQEKTPVDEDYDTWIAFMEKGGWTTGSTSGLGKTVNRAMETFVKANNGQTASVPEQLLPYLAPPVDLARLKEYWDVAHH